MKTAKLVFILTVTIALILLVVQNTSTVLARFLWFSAEMPAILLLLLTAVGGFALGILVVLFMRRTPGGGEDQAGSRVGRRQMEREAAVAKEHSGKEKLQDDPEPSLE